MVIFIFKNNKLLDGYTINLQQFDLIKSVKDFLILQEARCLDNIKMDHWCTNILLVNIWLMNYIPFNSKTRCASGYLTKKFEEMVKAEKVALGLLASLEIMCNFTQCQREKHWSLI
jgi:hypothetical protein